MSHKKIPVLWFSLILILILGTAGVAYGLWSKNLIILGTVNTGTVDVAFSLEEIDQMSNFNDYCDGVGTPYSIGIDCDGVDGLDDDMEIEGKDIAECDATISPDGYTMYVTITDAYPSFNCFIKYNVENTGSIPIHLYGPGYYYEGVYMGGELFAIDNDEIHVNGWPPEEAYAYEFSCPGPDEYVQLEPGEAAYCHLHIHPEQGAMQGDVIEFEIKYFARQWNEMVDPDWEQPDLIPVP